MFCSHRVVDKPRVELFARRLREDGIDAWLDKWEIRPGDDVVKAMEAGLDECEVGLVFLICPMFSGQLLMVISCCELPVHPLVVDL
ncbi:toll/interleukin-1 receptor domain-containing protein [Novosphingobium sp.]|uniref:toll/interleukin-1 receptor domain-containing protein n=1 Tax=Novosphingobium sp. TaxID=1874826 RepID=UPI003D6D64D8